MVCLGHSAYAELEFWTERFEELHGLRLNVSQAEYAVLSWSDASNVAWAGYVLEQSITWSEKETGSQKREALWPASHCVKS